MKQGYLVAIDLDGTLLEGVAGYNESCFNLIKKIAKQNYVIIATGRPWRGSKRYYDMLELKTPIINYNGALVHNPSDPNFQEVFITIDKQDAIDILNDNIDLFDNIFCEVNDDIYIFKEPNDDIDDYLHAENGRQRIGNFKDTLKENPNGVITFSPLGTENRLKEYIETKYNGRLLIRFWHHYRYVIGEIYNPLTTKGNALKHIIDYYNVPFEKTISIGDGNNDIEMFKVTNVKVAMGNSHPTLISHATHTAKNVSENGVYYFLKDFFYEGGLD